MWQYHFHIFNDYGDLILCPNRLHPKYPFNHPPSFSPYEEVPKKLKLFYWYLFNRYTIVTEFLMAKMPLIISRIIQREAKHIYFRQMLSWFKPLSAWKNIFQVQFSACRPDLELHIVILFFRTWLFVKICVKLQQMLVYPLVNPNLFLMKFLQLFLVKF